jgi:hypothetical protein
MGTGLALGLGIPFTRRMGAGIDAQAQAHFNRVIADGGLVPSGLVGVNNFFKTVKGIYGTSDITTAISVGLDAQVLGYKLGAGAGTTAGQAAQKLYSCSGASGDVVQTTAASQPLLLTHTTGNNYWFGSGIDGNFVSTPNRTPAGSTQLDIRVKFEGGNLNANRTFFSQSGAGGGETDIFILRFANASTGTINMLFGAGLALSQTSSVGIGAIANYMGWIRVTYSSNGTNADVTFFSSTDGSSWTQLSTHTVVSARLGNQNSPYQIGSNIGFNPFQGKISRATASNSIGGAPVVDFNPSQYNAATSQTQWTSSTGEVWTINTGTATTGYKGVLVDRSIVQGDGVDDTLDLNTFILPQPFTIYPAFNNIGDTSNGFLFDAVNTSSNRVLMIRDGGLNFSYETTPSSGAVAISRTVKTLELNSVVFNGASSSVQRNNGSSVIGNIGSSGFTSLRLGRASGSGGSNGNYVYNTFIIVSSADNSTIRTSMYNYIRSINNNAF